MIESMRKLNTQSQFKLNRKDYLRIYISNNRLILLISIELSKDMLLKLLLQFQLTRHFPLVSRTIHLVSPVGKSQYEHAPNQVVPRED